MVMKLTSSETYLLKMGNAMEGVCSFPGNGTWLFEPLISSSLCSHPTCHVNSQVVEIRVSNTHTMLFMVRETRTIATRKLRANDCGFGDNAPRLASCHIVAMMRAVLSEAANAFVCLLLKLQPTGRDARSHESEDPATGDQFAEPRDDVNRDSVAPAGQCRCVPPAVRPITMTLTNQVEGKSLRR
jgi:hypothetical protein